MQPPACAIVAAAGLPARWRGARDFTWLDVGPGGAHRFLALQATWRHAAASGAAPHRLHVVCVLPDAGAPSMPDEAEAQASGLVALRHAWPPASPDLHRIDFDGGRVRLLMAWGEASCVLADLELQADAAYACRPTAATLQRLARLCRPGAPLVVHTADGPRMLDAARAGFDAAPLRAEEGAGASLRVLQRKTIPQRRTIGSSRTLPERRAEHGLETRTAADAPQRPPHAAIVGAGLAGAAAARALARAGWRCTVFESAPAVATGGSGQPAGLHHAVVHADDGPHARWLRAASLAMTRWLRALPCGGRDPAGCLGAAQGLWRGADQPAQAGAALVQRLGLPPHVLQPAEAPEGTAWAGAWWMPGGGWARPRGVAGAWLREAGGAVDVRFGSWVAAIERAETPGWWLRLNAQERAGPFEAVVLANAGDAVRLAATVPAEAQPMAPAEGWMLEPVRGQTTRWPAADAPRWPVPANDGIEPRADPAPRACGGYVLRLPEGDVVCGATAQAGDDDPRPRADDDDANRARLPALLGLASADVPAPGTGLGTAGVRWRTADRMPLVGPMPQAAPADPRRASRARHWPGVDGIWLLTGLGSRGLTQALLAGELLAARMSSTPWPVPRALAEAVDPARFAARRARRGEPPVHRQAPTRQR